MMRRAIPGIACMGVAVCAAILSAYSTHAEILRQHILSVSALAWLMVGLFEGGALVMAMFAQKRVSRGESASWYRTCLTVLLGVAVVINVQHAWSSGTRGFGLVVGGLPPVILIVVLEAVWREHSKDEAERSTTLPAERPLGDASGSDRAANLVLSGAAITNDHLSGADRASPLTGDHAITDAEPAEIAADHEPAITSARTPLHAVPASDERAPVPPGPEREAIVDRLLAENPDITGTQVAEELGLAAPSGRRELGRARERAERSA